MTLVERIREVREEIEKAGGIEAWNRKLIVEQNPQDPVRALRMNGLMRENYGAL